MAKTPLTLEALKELTDTNEVVKIPLLVKTFRGWSEKDIKARLSAWRYRKCIDYKLDGKGDLKELIVLRAGRRRKNYKDTSKGAVIRSWLLCEVIEREVGIAEDTASNKNQIQKADDLIAKFINRVPDDIIALFFEELPERLERYLEQEKRL